VRLPDPPLLVVTDRRQARTSLAEIVGQVCAAGCRWISIREKDLPAAEQIALAQSLLPIAQRFGARLTLHGDARIAKAAGADGAHLPAGGGDPRAARAILGDDALVGISVHHVGEAAALDPRLIDYAIAGPVHETVSKPGYGPALGVGGFAAIVRASPVRVMAIGGIEPEVVADLLGVGAAGVAAMGSVMRAADPALEISNLLEAITEGRPHPLAR